MGIGFRIFLIDDNDSLQRLPMARYERLIGREAGERLPQHAGTRVRCAMVSLEVEGRTPQSIIRIDCTIIPFDEKGRIDRSEQEKEMRLVAEFMSPLSSIFEEKRTGKIVDARSQFAKKRYEQEFSWALGLEIEQAIIAAIFGSDQP